VRYIYNYLKGRLNQLICHEWKSNEADVFITIVRMINRIGLYDRLMDEEGQIFINEQVVTRIFRRQNLPDVTNRN
jgi:hypothetical protein